MYVYKYIHIVLQMAPYMMSFTVSYLCDFARNKQGLVHRCQGHLLATYVKYLGITKIKQAMADIRTAEGNNNGQMGRPRSPLSSVGILPMRIKGFSTVWVVAAGLKLRARDCSGRVRFVCPLIGTSLTLREGIRSFSMVMGIVGKNNLL